MAIADKLSYLQETKNQIKNAITEKGVSIADTDSFRSYAEKIGEIQGSITQEPEEWKPEADWWDIETILENDTEEYAQKIICLLSNELDDGAAINKVSGATKYKLSDGQIIEKTASSELDITTLFDKTKDKVCSKGYKTRYIIFYSNDNLNPILPDNVIYSIFSGVTFQTKPFSEKYYLQGIKLINNTKYTASSAESMFENCRSLREVIGLNTSNVTNMYNMYRNCCSLQKVPLMDTSKVTNMTSTFYNCYNLKEIREMETSNVTLMGNIFYYCYSLKEITGLETSKVTYMGNMFNNCYLLEKIAGLNTSNATNIDYMFNYCYSLKEIPELDTSKVSSMRNILSNTYLLQNIKGINKITDAISISIAKYLNHTSLIKLLNALVDLSGQTAKKLTIGTTNLEKLTDEEKAIATSKNWTLA